MPTTPHTYQSKAAAHLRQDIENPRFRNFVNTLVLPPGAGKTMVAIIVVGQFLRQHPGRHVLWLSPNWDLLVQAASSMGRICPHITCGRLGGDRSTLATTTPAITHQQVCFTTLQTLHVRSRSRLASCRSRIPNSISPAAAPLVVLDECHWAVNGQLGGSVTKTYLGHAPIIGLSATPKLHHAGAYRISYSRTYRELCPRFLCSPIIKQVSTQTNWSPAIRNGAITGGSLADLGTRGQRNGVILQTLKEGWDSGDFNRVVVFACDAEHADRLAELFSRSGLAARAVHWKESEDHNKESIEAYRKGTTRILVNVRKLTHGFDVPETDAVFLTAPTTSPILLIQMIGRGSRPTNRKNGTYRIVDFTDNIDRQEMSDRLMDVRTFFSDLGAGSERTAVSGNQRRRPTRHTEGTGQPDFAHLSLPGMEPVSYVVDQTFGVECELTSRSGVPGMNAEWRRVGRAIIREITKLGVPVFAEPVGYGRNSDSTRWYVSYDSSAGWEVISPILANQHGFDELRHVLVSLERLVKRTPELHLNYRTGMHVTLATRLNDPDQVTGFAARLQRIEPGLFTLVSPSRLFGFDGRRYQLNRRNSYCLPLRENLTDPRALLQVSQMSRTCRYRTVNLTRANDEVQLLEVRMHNGTVNWKKIVPWICLWMHIFNRSRYSWKGAGINSEVFPRRNSRVNPERVAGDDLFVLLAQEGISLGHGFENILRARRTALKQQWERVLPYRVYSWNKHGFYGPED